MNGEAVNSNSNSKPEGDGRLVRNELDKLFRRGLVWKVLLGIFVLVGASELYLNSYYFYGGHYGELQEEMALHEKYRGRLTDGRLDDFLQERWGSFHQKYPEESYNYMDAYYDGDGNELNIDGGGISVGDVFSGVHFPIEFGYFEGWSLFLDQLPRYVKYLPIFIAVAFSALFSYERQCGMEEMLLCAKRGRRDCARAKVAGAFLVTNALCGAVVLLPSLIAFFLYQGNGLGTSIQMTPWLRDTQLEMDYGTLYLHMIILSFLAVNVVLLIALTAAFLARSPMTALCVTLGVLYLMRPDLISGYFPIDGVKKLTALTPVNVVDAMNLAKQVPVAVGGVKLHWLAVAEVMYSSLLVGGGLFFFRMLGRRFV
ncbi:MAG: hypothetical protein HFH62_01415 [Lachnospiraceae bacterium]|nr:hypothetical protein [Lachnospiraceae bacterium]